jgi:hypothetical protein
MPLRTNILSVRSVRNAAQHQARLPTPSEVHDSRTRTKDFLIEFVKAVWDLRFESLTLLESIEDRQIRDELKDAESHLKQGDFREAVFSAAVAITRALDRATVALVGSLDPFDKSDPRLLALGCWVWYRECSKQ